MLCLEYMFKGILPVFLVTSFLISCDGNAEIGPNDEVSLRIHNKSALTFDEIFVAAPNDSNTYYNLNPGLASPYKQFKKLYRYSYIRIKSADREFILQPIDYVGESPLNAGKYTYVLDIDDPNYTYSVSLELRQD